jgi:hypothetical protein
VNCDEEVHYNTIKRYGRIELTCSNCGLTLEIKNGDKTERTPEKNHIRASEEIPSPAGQGLSDPEQTIFVTEEPEYTGLVEYTFSQLESELQKLEELKDSPSIDKIDKSIETTPSPAADKVMETAESPITPAEDISSSIDDTIPENISAYKEIKKDSARPDEPGLKEMHKDPRISGKEAEETSPAEQTEPSNESMVRISSGKKAYEDLTGKLSEKKESRSKYIKNINYFMIAEDKKSTFNTVKSALAEFPFDPLFLSFYGYLIADIERDTNRGVKICREAINRLDTEFPSKKTALSPLLYLNLGKAYILSNRKQEAVTAFRKGLISGPKNIEISGEMRKLGIRNRPPIPFLDRSNPINKYIGLFLYKVLNIRKSE